jgi:hypothetical protein
MAGSARGRNERGMITLWILGLTVSVMFLGGLSVDLWRAIAVRREVSVMADAAATAGANGLDENALRGGALQLDEVRSRQLVAAALAEFPNAGRIVGGEVSVVGPRVSVTLRETVHFTLLGIFVGRGQFVVQARASAEPREIP